MFLGITPQDELKLSIKTDRLISYLKTDNLFFYEEDNWGMRLKSISGTNYFYLMDKHSKEESVFYSHINKKETIREIITYQSLPDLASVHFSFNHRQNIFCIYSNEEGNRNSIDLRDNKFGNLHKLYEKENLMIRIQKVFEENMNDYTFENIKYFVEDIKISNYQKYYDLINNNKDKLKNLTSIYIESKKMHLDFFNLNKENKDVLTLKTDIICDFVFENHLKSKSIFSFLKK